MLPLQQIFQNSTSLLAVLFTGMLFISLTSPRNLWLADISKKRLEGEYRQKRYSLEHHHLHIHRTSFCGLSIQVE
jgi:hypothetical protein